MRSWGVRRVVEVWGGSPYSDRRAWLVVGLRGGGVGVSLEVWGWVVVVTVGFGFVFVLEVWLLLLGWFGWGKV